MSVPFSNTNFRIPKGFANLLEGLTREILREQPTDIPLFAAKYFAALLKQRQESNFDPAEWGAVIEDRLSNNNAFKHAELNTNASESEENKKIRTETISHLENLEENSLSKNTFHSSSAEQTENITEDFTKAQAATTIQAAFRGHVAKKEVKRKKKEIATEDDPEHLIASSMDEPLQEKQQSTEQKEELQNEQKEDLKTEQNENLKTEQNEDLQEETLSDGPDILLETSHEMPAEETGATTSNEHEIIDQKQDLDVSDISDVIEATNLENDVKEEQSIEHSKTETELLQTSDTHSDEDVIKNKNEVQEDVIKNENEVEEDVIKNKNEVEEDVIKNENEVEEDVIKNENEVEAETVPENGVFRNSTEQTNIENNGLAMEENPNNESDLLHSKSSEVNETEEENETSRKQQDDALDIALDDPDANAAAAKIQAGFRGHMTRKKMKSGEKELKNKDAGRTSGDNEGD